MTSARSCLVLSKFGQLSLPVGSPPFALNVNASFARGAVASSPPLFDPVIFLNNNPDGFRLSLAAPINFPEMKMQIVAIYCRV